MIETPMNSSALLGFRYDPDHQLLWIRFPSGNIYVYHSVPAETVEALVAAPSHGQYFNSAIRGCFKFHRLS
jgi:hypothetical protein